MKGGKNVNYTLVHMEAVQRGDYISIEKSGNKYLVFLGHKRDGEESEFVHKEFDSLQAAYKVYEKLSLWLVFGLYSFKDRKSYLLTGTMD